MAEPAAMHSYANNGRLYQSPISRNQQAFRPFIHHVAPDPLPGPARFYLDNMTGNAVDSYEVGFTRYFKNMRENPTMGVLIGALTIGLSLMMTAFKKHQNLIQAAFLLSFLGYPVMAAVRHVPKMMDSYDLAKAGEPTRARKEFRQSFDELTYQVFHNYLKPLSLAAFTFYPLLNFRRSILFYVRKWVHRGLMKLGKNPAEKGLRRMTYNSLNHLGKTLKILSDSAPVKVLDRFAVRLEKWGDRLLAPISNKLPRF